MVNSRGFYSPHWHYGGGFSMGVDCVAYVELSPQIMQQLYKLDSGLAYPYVNKPEVLFISQKRRNIRGNNHKMNPAPGL